MWGSWGAGAAALVWALTVACGSGASVEPANVVKPHTYNVTEVEAPVAPIAPVAPSGVHPRKGVPPEPEPSSVPAVNSTVNSTPVHAANSTASVSASSKRPDNVTTSTTSTTTTTTIPNNTTTTTTPRSNTNTTTTTTTIPHNTTTSTTITPKSEKPTEIRKKPTVTIGTEELPDAPPLPPLTSSTADPDGPPLIIAPDRRGGRSDMVVPAVIAVFATPLFAFFAFQAWRRSKEAWQNRHYRRMDYLIEGMYNE